MLALLLALPLASHALHICTDASGKSSFQDKPCETRDAALQYAPLKAVSVTEAGAQETVKRFTGAMGARDVVAMRRLMARSFESRIFLSSDKRDPAVVSGAQMSEMFSRVLQAAKAYRIQRSCSRDSAQDVAGEIALRCAYKSHLALLNRTVESSGEEFVRVGVENGELKLVEISEPKAIEALRAKATAQASR
jgi:hypothetical protein